MRRRAARKRRRGVVSGERAGCARRSIASWSTAAARSPHAAALLGAKWRARAYARRALSTFCIRLWYLWGPSLLTVDHHTGTKAQPPDIFFSPLQRGEPHPLCRLQTLRCLYRTKDKTVVPPQPLKVDVISIPGVPETEESPFKISPAMTTVLTAP